ncbi:MAG: glycosyltransferase family 39 protein, partial [Candidatus Daviesbacteria bacterium]|nr:glycosyltransferase family 39 protein [Candidatus Daviesbacteria bacterium]
MIWIITGIALILRLICLNQSLWLDEAINVLSAKNLDLISFVTKYPIGDYHPPGYFFLLWVWSHTFGFSEISVRLPSVFFGVGTVILTYLIGKSLFNKKIGIIASFLLAVSPLHIYYSQEARMYSLSTFSVVLFSYFFVRLLNGKKYSFIWYVLSGILVLYSDYVVYLIFPVHFLFLVLTRRNLLIKWLIAVSASTLFFLPWINVLMAQIAEGMKAKIALPEWSKVAGGADLKNI